ncbi:glucosaminidase domain-containing protein [Sulfurimonas sp.]
MIKYISIVMLLVFFSSSLFGFDSNSKKYTAQEIPKNMSVVTKKKRFYYLLVPAVQKVHSELMQNYLRVKKNIIHNTDTAEIEKLKVYYKVKTNDELLYALKPHPQSIALAQAAMESAWGTSRFFREAYNVFGMWSSNKNEPRIAAGIKRDGNRTVWLRKFNSIEESVRAYYKLMAKGKAFKSFREVRYKTKDVHKIVKELHNYSEIGDLYAKELSQMIKYNKLIKYDNQL